LVLEYRPVLPFARDSRRGALALMRACTRCGEEKPLDAFHPVRRGEATLQSWCRDCFAQANARNYRANRERESARIYKYTAERRTEVGPKDHRLSARASIRGLRRARHRRSRVRSPRDKVADISAYAGGGRTWARVQGEIAECEVRCANCHRRHTARNGRYYRALATIARIDALTP
jgi:hypothetical protein